MYTYIILQGKKGITGVIKLRILKMGDYDRLSGLAQYNHDSCYK